MDWKFHCDDEKNPDFETFTAHGHNPIKVPKFKNRRHDGIPILSIVNSMLMININNHFTLFNCPVTRDIIRGFRDNTKFPIDFGFQLYLTNFETRYGFENIFWRAIKESAISPPFWIFPNCLENHMF
jgi:hypothetical protein